MTHKSPRPARAPAKSYPPGSLLGKIRQRGLLGAGAAMLASGWFVYELVHYILVEHYGLPKRLEDITIVGVVSAILCLLTWRWFRGEPKARKFRCEFVLIPLFIGVGAAVNLNFILHLGEGGRHGEPPAGEDKIWKNSVTVLPFLNLSADKDQEYFCDGLTEELITRLSQVGSLKVPARTSAFAFKGEGRDIREVGKKLGVEKVLEGSVRKDGPRLRVAVQLINAADGFHLWSHTYDRDLDEVIRVQDEIAQSVAEAMKMSLSDRGSSESQTRNFEAYNELMRGLYNYATPTKENLEAAARHFGKAVELDPDYARAWAGLGGTIAFQASVGYIPVKENRDRAAAALERALALNDRQADAYRDRGWMRMSFDWDWNGAEEDYKKASELDPGPSLVAASQLELGFGRFDRALAMARKAAELDSLNGTVHMNLGFTAYCAGRLDEAREHFERTLALSPKRASVHALLALVSLREAKPEAALARLEKEEDRFFFLSTRAMVLHALGREKESSEALERIIADYRDGGAYQVAQIYALRGEADRAFEWLEIAYEQHDGGLFLVKVDPPFESLRKDPRFAAFLDKMRLPRS